MSIDERPEIVEERSRVGDWEGNTVIGKNHKGKLHTPTYDNGKEMAEHEQITEELGLKVYFAHPYSSWERGVNENTNGLIRQYFPKDRELTGITRQEVEQAMERLNHRPRNTFGFRTSYEVFFSTHTHLTVALGG